MKSLEQRMNRFSWACAAMLVLGGVGASGQAAAACEFVDHAPNEPQYWNPMFNFGVVRIEAGHDTPPLGEPLTDWVEISGTLKCDTADTYDLSGDLASNGRPNLSVVVDGKTYVTRDAAGGTGDPDAGVGFITEVDIGSSTYPVQSADNGSGPGPVFGTISLFAGETNFVARRRIVGLGTRIPEGAAPAATSLIPRLVLDENSGTEDYIIGASSNAIVVYQVASCAPTGIDQEVQIGPFSLSDTPGQGMPWPQEKEFGFQVTCPADARGRGINVHALFTDNANPSNTGQALTLTGDAIPAGVELRLFQENDTAISFGPEAAETNAPGAFPLFTAPPEGIADKAVTFKAKLFQTGQGLSAGEINAAARVTLTYD